MKNLENKVDALIETTHELAIAVAKQQVTLERNTESLELHMKRSDAIEGLLAAYKEEQDAKWSFLKGIVWTLGTLATFALTLLGIYLR